MANLIITRDLATFNGAAPNALVTFKNADKRGDVALPAVKDGIVSWSVADTPENRALFRSEYEPSGFYSCESIDQKAPEAFNVTAKANAPKPPGKR